MAGCPACGAALPEEARFCPVCGAPTAPGGEERKLATVLFADLVGSTELGEGDPERTRARLERFYDAMAAEIEAAGGTVEKFAGDAVMAAFGAPAAQEDHAERALHAALAMRRRLGELFGHELQLRLGVNTGEVLLGRARAGSSFVSGDAVNIAARLEQAATPGEILAGERSVAAARGAFEFAELRTLEAKGKAEGVRGASVLRALSLMRPRGVAGLRAAFVGREHELETLREVYRHVVERGEPGLTTIVGDAGVGKTRLVRELWQWLAEHEPRPYQRTGRCSAYGSGNAYSPLGEVLREQLGIAEGDPPSEVLERLGECRLLGLSLGLDVGGDLHPLVVRDRLQDEWASFLTDLAGERPVVLLIEDLHWAEPPLFELLERLLRDVRGPLLLIATARPELLDRRPGWGSRGAGRVLALEPLTEVDSARMLTELLARELPERLRDSVVERSEGNPFFVEELLGTLIDRGVLVREDGRWTARELPHDFAVPDTVQAVLAARIDLLEADEKEALQAAAVIGRVFWAGPVYQLVGERTPDLGVLEDRDFIRRRPGTMLAGEREYVIKHALTREVAYAGLPRRRRAHLHAAFAEWLEQAGAGRDEHVHLLAHHYAAAVKPEDADLAWPDEADVLGDLRARAVTWLRRAADLAISRYEVDEGLALLRRALPLVAVQSEQASLWQEIGHASALKYDGEAFVEAIEHAIALGGPAADLYGELGLQAALKWGMWRRQLPAGVIDGWIEQALQLSAPESRARARALAARGYWANDGEAARGADELAQKLGDARLRAFAFLGRSGSAAASREYDAARAWAARCIDSLAAIDDPDFHCHAYFRATGVSSAAGRIDEALELAQRQDELVGPLTPHHRVHGVAGLIEVHELAGHWGAILDLKERCERVVSANDTPCAYNVKSLRDIALASAHRGDASETSRLERAADAFGMEGYPFMLVPAVIDLALVRRDLGRVEELVDDLDMDRAAWAYQACRARLDALAALGRRNEVEAEAPQLLVPGTYLEPFALRALGRVREDERLVARALERFRALGLDWHAEQTKVLVG